ncbi:homoserine O-acetyltransferase MetX [Xanthomonas oryzae pv. oryzicola]|uniref:homoserine O-acetyltransferase MetX n=1 Tax=Xanthomonas oryzae TaxID=347 RepID=UPI0004246F75|nr:homoserine O-acetyltransferase [Xanthomonas oryzae]AKK64348.1 homoserine acetyltransferase [Xanthomonas oryzae pv. oryzicola]AKO04324.1 homoserine acetyltransferase [Xanthomonas oryzae pv. oryzicola]AKO08212.1 homoserine acetyltransferase [Xanthomonas oryzae pv. oryzicola]OWB25392.1 homoserine O-acetyltransferase [Xanthomonas oryzae pv. oryzicola]OWB26407.1 homoserine O-acetyltransferase [Xanthomonas oryzae pv. oryzicola]
MTEFIPAGTLYHALPSPFPMKRGGVLHQARVAYETWGTLAADRSNALLIVTGLSPNAHAAANQSNPEPGWWEAMVGPGKPINTARWFVVCVNSLGSCKGSTGPASVNPATGALYRLTFPDLSIEDVADAAADVVRALGIAQLACLIGNSMGGMTALAMLLRHPGIARSHINISGSAQALPFSIAIRSLQREAIRLDPHWNGGHYDDAHYPESGMRMARKLGVITYRSALEWDGRFGRVRLDSEQAEDDPFGLEFQVESYLEGHARRFVRFFDPNCYLYLSRSMDWFDLAEYVDDKPAADMGIDSSGADALPAAAKSETGVSTTATVLAGLARIRIARALAIGANTDILFPVQQQEQIADGLRAGGADARFIGLDSPQGHDAFLVDFARFGPAVRDFLQGC